MPAAIEGDDEIPPSLSDDDDDDDAAADESPLLVTAAEGNADAAPAAAEDDLQIAEELTPMQFQETIIDSSGKRQSSYHLVIPSDVCICATTTYFSCSHTSYQAMIRSRDAVTTSACFVRMDTQACGECAVAALQKAREYQEQTEGKNLTDEETKDAIDKLNDREYTGELYLPLPPSFYLSIYLYTSISINLSLFQVTKSIG